MSIIDTDDVRRIVSQRLAQIRQERGYNQEEMAGLLHTFQEAYHLIEREKRSIKMIELYFISAEIGVNIAWILGLSDEKYSHTAKVKHQEHVTRKEKEVIKQARPNKKINAKLN